ncbi:MAG: 4Fe-4S binding protein, partial [Chloroflexi bacterium]|nr:4Fe-4S binding protein [Chloroflexota bacterium]
MHIKYWRRGRQAVQALSLIVFTLLVIYTLRDVQGLLAADELMRLDPLAGIAAMVASRRWMARFIPALILLGATLVLGRFWCGWLCPLGTLIDWTSRSPERNRPIPKVWRRAKYGLLFLILFAALWGNLTLLLLDPLTIFVRAVGTVVVPALNWVITEAEIVLYRAPALYRAVDAVDGALRGPILSYTQPLYLGALLTSALLGDALALNLATQRAWCRYVCPLGGLLSLAARVSWLKRKHSGACAYCGACEEACPMGTI